MLIKAHIVIAQYTLHIYANTWQSNGSEMDPSEWLIAWTIICITIRVSICNAGYSTFNYMLSDGFVDQISKWYLNDAMRQAIVFINIWDAFAFLPFRVYYDAKYTKKHRVACGKLGDDYKCYIIHHVVMPIT